jgi:hypothetical protein
MKIYVPLVVLLLFYFQSLADPSPVYCFNADITLKSGKVMTGYFNFDQPYILNDETGFYYFDGSKMLLRVTAGKGGLIVNADDYHFSNEVKRHLHEVDVYQDVLFIGPIRNSDDKVGVFFGQGVKLKAEQIQDLTIRVIYILNPIARIETKLKEEDKTWIAEHPTIIVDAGGSEGCDYQALYFNNDKEKLLSELRQLKNLFKKYSDVATAQQWDQQKGDLAWNDILKEIERLRAYHILIKSSCSC